MYLCYDVVKIILEIKYKNWVKEKKCLCGGEDFKVCHIIECYQCPRNYCLFQKGYEKWMWMCSYCRETFCGHHEFKQSRNREKFCSVCIHDDTFKFATESELDCFSDDKVMAVYLRKYSQSPEY